MAAAVYYNVQHISSSCFACLDQHRGGKALTYYKPLETCYSNNKIS